MSSPQIWDAAGDVAHLAGHASRCLELMNSCLCRYRLSSDLWPTDLVLRVLRKPFAWEACTGTITLRDTVVPFSRLMIAQSGMRVGNSKGRGRSHALTGDTVEYAEIYATLITRPLLRKV